MLESCIDGRLDDDACVAVPNEGRQALQHVVDGVFEPGLGAAGVVGSVRYRLLKGGGVSGLVEKAGVAHRREHQDRA